MCKVVPRKVVTELVGDVQPKPGAGKSCTWDNDGRVIAWGYFKDSVDGALGATTKFGSLANDFDSRTKISGLGDEAFSAYNQGLDYTYVVFRDSNLVVKVQYDEYTSAGPIEKQTAVQRARIVAEAIAKNL